MKFIQIGHQFINLDNVFFVSEVGDTLYFYSPDTPDANHSVYIMDDTPGYASLKAYLLNLCIARFDAESDAAMGEPKVTTPDVGDFIRIKAGVYAQQIGVITKITGDGFYAAISGIEFRIREHQFEVIPSDVQE